VGALLRSADRGAVTFQRCTQAGRVRATRHGTTVEYAVSDEDVMTLWHRLREVRETERFPGRWPAGRPVPGGPGS
jgi:hypothetical protein